MIPIVLIYLLSYLVALNDRKFVSILNYTVGEDLI